jgi:hypothetical protein
MRQIFTLFAICFVSLPNPICASVDPVEALPVCQQLVTSWQVKKDPLSQNLWEELAMGSSSEILDIVAATCNLATADDSTDVKASIAFNLNMNKTADRQQVAPMAIDLRGHFAQAGHTRTAIDIMDALFDVPPHQRSTIYQALKAGPISPETSLQDFVASTVKQFTCTDRVRMYMNYKLSASNPTPVDTVSICLHLMNTWDRTNDGTEPSLMELFSSNLKDPQSTSQLWDVMSKTCRLCLLSDANNDKANVARILGLQTNYDRHQVVKLTNCLRKSVTHGGFAHRAISEILMALLAVPSYQRDKLCAEIKTMEFPASQSLVAFAIAWSQALNPLSKGSMYVLHQTGGLFGLDTHQAKD